VKSSDPSFITLINPSLVIIPIYFPLGDTLIPVDVALCTNVTLAGS